MKHPVLILTALVLGISACSLPAVQTSSGARYNDTYQPVRSTPQTRSTVRYVNGERVSDTIETISTDRLVREAAAVEPLLKLPAKIGLARIENGILSTIPQGEAQLWGALADRHAALGTFAPVDPFVAHYTSQLVLPQDEQLVRRDATDIIAKIRIGAARQHMDAVLIYEVGIRGKKRPDLRRLSVLGAAPLPVKTIEKEGVARAFLMDVRNGYPYGITSVSVDLGALEGPWWDADRGPVDPMRARTAIAGALVPEVERIFGRLARQMSDQRIAAK